MLIKKIVYIGIFLCVIGGIGIGILKVFGLSSNNTEIHKKETVASENINEIEINTSAADVELVPTDLNEIEILLDGNIKENIKDKYTFKVNEKNNKLNIDFLTNDNSLGLHLGSISDMKLKVNLPKKGYENIKVKTTSGQIIAEGIEGKILTMEATSGNISTIESKIKKELTAETSSGTIKINKSEAGIVNFKTSSGKIDSNNLVSKNANFEDISGEIKYNNKTLKGDIAFQTSNGDVKINFDKVPTSFKVGFEGNSGKADIDVEGLLYEDKSKNKAIAIKGDGENKIKVRTSSGDLKLK
ncbi:DUF4097 family beta strand repeat-containing protein [Bacillus cereus]|nr:DUF4097 family beta strand repeat-containing protein [Bacillus cereus]